MTDYKRFKLYEHKDHEYILDNPDESLDFIELLGDALTSEEIVDRLNAMDERIQTLELRCYTLNTRNTNARNHVKDLIHDFKRGFLGVYDREDFIESLEKILWYLGDDKNG